MARRILIVSASMGAGHDGAANGLRKRLESQAHSVCIVDFLDLAGELERKSLRADRVVA